jgi:hypothetical protein
MAEEASSGGQGRVRVVAPKTGEICVLKSFTKIGLLFINV